MATHTTLCPDTNALRKDVWTLTLDKAARASLLLSRTHGSRWEAVVARPLRQPQRLGTTIVTVITGGFSSGEFSNALYTCDIPIERN